MSNFETLSAAIIKGDRKEAVRLTQEAIDAKADPRQVLDAMVAGMDDIGRKFQNNEVFVPEMLIAARAMKESIALLEPLLVEAGIKPEVTAVIGTVQGDLHDIGKNLVAMVVEGGGYKVVDLGVDVSAEKFLAAVKENPGAVVGLSALLTTTMVNMEKTVKLLKEQVPGTRVIVGGAPLTSDFAKKIGADGYSPDPQGALNFLVA